MNRDQIILKSAEIDEAVLGRRGSGFIYEHGRGARPQDQKEWWVFRRLVRSGKLLEANGSPCEIWKSERPDFLVHSVLGNISAVEVTEATSPLDQSEATRSQFRGPHMLGAHGGRGSEGYGGDQAEREVCADLLRALRRKCRVASAWLKQRGLSRWSLTLYVNSNPGKVAELRESAELFWLALDRWRDTCWGAAPPENIWVLGADDLVVSLAYSKQSGSYREPA